VPADLIGAAARHLAVRLPVLTGDLPPPDHEPGEARDAADRILSQGRYQWHDDRSLLERIGDWVAEQVGRLVAPFGIATGGVPTWVGWLVLVALAALVGALIYRARGGWRRDAVGRGSGDARIVVDPGDGTVDWAAEAARCESQGRWREALRARYRVLVGDLAGRRVIGDLVGRTAGELLADVRTAAPPAGPAFRRATDMFEATWYGGADVGPADLARFAEVAGEVLAAARARSGPAVGA
jgi:Domain of unknown function (DUF4129)